LALIHVKRRPTHRDRHPPFVPKHRLLGDPAQITKRRIDRDFPRQVAILIPEGGLVARLIAIHKFCAANRRPITSGFALQIGRTLMRSWWNPAGERIAIELHKSLGMCDQQRDPTRAASTTTRIGGMRETMSSAGYA
jgi:hypothetical protein